MREKRTERPKTERIALQKFAARQDKAGIGKDVRNPSGPTQCGARHAARIYAGGNEKRSRRLRAKRMPYPKKLREALRKFTARQAEAE